MGKIFVAVLLSIHAKRQIPNKIWVMWTGAIRAIVNKLYFKKKIIPLLWEIEKTVKTLGYVW